ncbi:MAG: type III secretion system export apparatus subunit SctV [Deltaproteobacteria bacterium]|nr:type III secretion system export apparatus subunit SctV [Deltaproteobacteria bacterium]
MKILNALAAVPFGQAGRKPDVLLAVGVAAIVGMLIVPIPGFILDPLIAVNIAVSLTVLMVALFAKTALDVSSFPTLLLITTLYRLALNVSTTRGILSKAEAGEMVKAFGQFVVQGDMVVGGTIFLVLTLVQFLVIAKGAERVAEVGARFTLDAMPGKQMSIDAAVRSGSITEEEGQDKREELGRASQMFGNMDGAMKFVKGDAIAGLIITALNVVAGVLIGITRMNMRAGDALEVFAILTIGDGLVAQISSLLVTLAAGILVTRVEAKDKTKNLGHTIKDELLSNTKVLNIGAGLMLVMGFIPGLPMLPFLLCAVAAASMSASAKIFTMLAKKAPGAATIAKQAAFRAQLQKKMEEAKQQKSITESLAPTVVPVGIDLDPGLAQALGFTMEEADDDAELIKTFIPQLRDALFLETGVRFPGVRVRPHVKGLPENSFVVRINDVPVMQERIVPGKCLATVHPEKLQRLGVQAVSIHHPVSRAEMALIDGEDKAVVEAAGINVWNESGLLALYVASVLRRRVKDFIGLQEVSDMVERLEKAYPSLVKEVVPKVCTVQQLVGVLRRLVEEGVSIRNLKSIIEALGEFGTRDGDGVFLTEKVRSALSTQLAYSYAGLSTHLPVVMLDPVIEDTIASSIHQNAHGQVLTLAPEICRAIISSIATSLQPMVAQGKRPVVLTNCEIRRFVRKVLETDLPGVAVLSFDELPAELTIQPLGRAELPASC